MVISDFNQQSLHLLGEPDLKTQDRYDKIIELAKRRGFFWYSYEIYGGAGGLIDFGPLGSSLKRKIEAKWRDMFVRRHDFLEIETPIVGLGKVFEASGHTKHFTDKMIQCGKCKRRWRADHLIQEQTGITGIEGLSLEELDHIIREKGIRCSICGGDFDKPQFFNLMFKTSIGPYEESLDYLRPEAAQAMFTNFKRLNELTREKFPFAVAQIGHALRNEISPRQGPIRLREFTIMEFEFFFDPEDPRCPKLKEVKDDVIYILPAEEKSKGKDKPLKLTVKEALKQGLIKTEWQAYFMAISQRFVTSLGIPPEKQRFDEKLPWEKAHYSAQTYDHEIYTERWGWIEVAGHAYRTDYDLKMHMEKSGEDMRIFKAYEKPLIKEKLAIKPKKDAIGKEFKSEAATVLKLISEASPEEVQESFKKQGYYMAGPYKILKEHVRIERQKIKETGRRFIPHVVEPSFGAERLVYAALEYAYTEKDDRVILKFPRDIAPIQVTVLPVVSKDGLPEKARSIYEMLIEEGFTVDYDEAGSIGRRYSRADEIGVPIAITTDYKTLKENTVTLRNRDTWAQVRNNTEEIPNLLEKFFKSDLEFNQLGTPVRSSKNE